MKMEMCSRILGEMMLTFTHRPGVVTAGEEDEEGEGGEEGGEGEEMGG